jgi:hypothetical protein
MDDSDRCRMYKLQQELNSEAGKLLNEKLLLRPNTNFAVAWKILFVVAIIFEISQLAMKPWIQKHNHPVTGAPLDFESFMEHHLIPTPVSQLPACEIRKVEHGPKVLGLVKRAYRKLARREVVLPKSHPWYCGPIYSTSQAGYIQMCEFIIHEFLILVGIVCFLDVFVTFFTGEIDQTTGCLSPKPFFARWFSPGLVLQLAVNPKMDSTSHVVVKVRRDIG